MLFKKREQISNVAGVSSVSLSQMLINLWLTYVLVDVGIFNVLNVSVILFSWVYKLEELTMLSNHWKEEEMIL